MASIMLTLTANADSSGICGENLTWTYESETQTLIISGSGKMFNYNPNNTPFWNITISTCIIEEGVTSVGDFAFYRLSNLSSITLPNSLESIGIQAFYGCTSLTSITLANSLTSIGSQAFYGCTSLTSITLAKSLTSIGNFAFCGCYRINTIYCLNPIPPTCERPEFKCDGDNVRDPYEVYTYANLHVPMGSKELYASAYDWRYFEKIKEDMESDGTVYYANLTVQQGTTGYTRQSMKSDERYTIFIGSLGEYKVNAVTFNGFDVTEDIVDGYYTTPEIKGESILSISYEIPSNIPSNILNNVKVTGYNGMITISNIDEPSDVNVYFADGKLINTISSAYDSVNIVVNSNQLYVIKVGNRTYKVAL